VILDLKVIYPKLYCRKLGGGCHLCGEIMFALSDSWFTRLMHNDDMMAAINK